MATKKNETTNSNANYSATINEASRDFSPKERIMMKDTSDAIHLDEATRVDAIVVKPVAWAVLDIHNEKSEDKDYQNFIIIDENGQKYVTGSKSFWSSFRGIYDEMNGSDEEWGIKIFSSPSKNYKGKSFITCSLV